MRTLKRSDYSIGWICALPLELAASGVMLDEEHTFPSDLGWADENTYKFGTIQNHNVVMACLPSGRIGKTAVATLAANMRSSYESLRFGLMVGIGGGIPSKEKDIRLGDVAVSKPSGRFGGVVQYNFGATGKDGFKRKGFLNSPPTVLLSALSALRTNHETNRDDFKTILSNALTKLPETFAYPGEKEDLLFEEGYGHVKGSRACEQCDKGKLQKRPLRNSRDPDIFYGTIASGDQVMANDIRREELRKEDKAICFEMEAAGLMNDFPCVVIRGISDYSDTHKNARWKRYAATAAAAYAKTLLCVIRSKELGETSPMSPSAPSTAPVSTVRSRSSDPDRCSDAEFTFLTTGYLGVDEVALGRLVLNLDAPADDYCPISPVKITRKDVSVLPFPGIRSLLLEQKDSSFARSIAKLFSCRKDISVPDFVAKSAKTSRLLNSGDYFQRLLQNDEVKTWLENVYKSHDVYLMVGIHSFSDDPESSMSSNPDDNAPFTIPGNWIVGVRYRKVRLRVVDNGKIESGFLKTCARWRKYVTPDPHRGDKGGRFGEMLEATLEEDVPFKELKRNHKADIYRPDEMGEYFFILVVFLDSTTETNNQEGSPVE